MRCARSVGLAVGVTLLITACATKPPDKQWFMPAISKSPSVIAYSRKIAGSWSCVIDDDESDFVVVAVGEDFPDHFVRGLTAKVLRNGDVYVLQNRGGDESWRLDYNAGRN